MRLEPMTRLAASLERKKKRHQAVLILPRTCSRALGGQNQCHKWYCNQWLAMLRAVLIIYELARAHQCQTEGQKLGVSTPLVPKAHTGRFYLYLERRSWACELKICQKEKSNFTSNRHITKNNNKLYDCSCWSLHTFCCCLQGQLSVVTFPQYLLHLQSSVYLGATVKRK